MSIYHEPYNSNKSEREKKAEEIRVDLTRRDGVHLYKISEFMETGRKDASPIWKAFGLVMMNKKKTHFAACRSCKLVLSYHHSVGTNPLARHLNKDNTCPGEKMPKIDAVVAMTKNFKIAPPAAKSNLIDASIKFVSRDMRSFNALAQPGLKALVQAAIDVGNSYGRVDANVVLPAPNTCRNHVLKKQAEAEQCILNLLNKQYEEGFQVCGSTDGWKSEIQQIDCIGITVHFVDAQFVLHDRVLGSFEMIDQKKTGLEIAKKLQGEFMRFGINLNDRSITFVTDQASNMKKACNLTAEEQPDATVLIKSQIRYNCLAHVINRALDATFDRLKGADHEFYLTVEAAKSIIEYLKRASLMCKFDKKLVQQVPTRWLSRCAMLHGILDQWEKIVHVLYAKNMSALLVNISQDVLSELIDFLEVFNDCTKLCEATKTPTAQLVPKIAETLLMHCSNRPGDAPELELPKQILKGLLKDKFDMSETIGFDHKIAVFLDPNTRSMKVFDQSSRANILAEVKRRILSLYDFDEPVEDNATAAPPAKKQNLLAQFRDDSNAALGPVDKELENYTEYRIELPAPADGELDILKFWFNHKFMFPRLASLARDVFSVPATSTASERLFSAQGNTITAQRNRLAPKTVNALLFLRSNHDLIPNTMRVVNDRDNVVVNEFTVSDEDDYDVGDDVPTLLPC